MGKLIRKIESIREPLLQVALDFTDIDSAVRIIRELRDLKIDIFEFGTPLVKSVGLANLKPVAELISYDTILLADTKTADVGDVEARIVKESGFHVMTVLALADDEVISNCVKSCEKLDLDVVVDTIALIGNKLIQRLEVLKELGVRFVNIHVGIDVQRRRGLTAKDMLRELRDIINSFKGNFIFSVSGGIKPQDAHLFADAGASIIVIGSAITKSDNPREAASIALKSLKG